MRKFRVTDKLFSLYKITNKLNNKSYIGITSKNPKNRWNSHINGSSKCKAICAAIKKYGKDNFIFEVIEEIIDEKIAYKQEIFLIDKYNSYGLNGYNLSIGGVGPTGYKHSMQTRKKLSEKTKNNYDLIFTEKTRKKLSENGKHDSDSYHRRFTEKTRKKLSEKTKNMIEMGHNARGDTIWTITNNLGEDFIIKNPTIWCRENNIAFKTLWVTTLTNKPVSKGKLKGWIVKTTNKKKLKTP